jgi:hypothetical protein
MPRKVESPRPGRAGRHGQSPLRWMFESRETGRLTVAQWPNLPLAVFLADVVLRWIIHPRHAFAAGLSIVAGVALAMWAVDELVRGVNPFRRLLGAVVLIGQIAALATRWWG